MNQKDFHKKWDFKKNDSTGTMRTYIDLDQFVEMVKDKQQSRKIVEIKVKFK